MQGISAEMWTTTTKKCIFYLKFAQIKNLYAIFKDLGELLRITRQNRVSNIGESRYIFKTLPLTDLRFKVGYIVDVFASKIVQPLLSKTLFFFLGKQILIIKGKLMRSQSSTIYFPPVTFAKPS